MDAACAGCGKARPLREADRGRRRRGRGDGRSRQTQRQAPNGSLHVPLPPSDARVRREHPRAAPRAGDVWVHRQGPQRHPAAARPGRGRAPRRRQLHGERVAMDPRRARRRRGAGAVQGRHRCDDQRAADLRRRLDGVGVGERRGAGGAGPQGHHAVGRAPAGPSFQRLPRPARPLPADGRVVRRQRLARPAGRHTAGRVDREHARPRPDPAVL